MGKARAQIIAMGRVQGVFYRASARDRATELGLTGWVRNKEDGTVEIVAEGDSAKLKELVGWCGRGPKDAMVEDVSVSWSEHLSEFKGFEVR